MKVIVLFFALLIAGCIQPKSHVLSVTNSIQVVQNKKVLLNIVGNGRWTSNLKNNKSQSPIRLKGRPLYSIYGYNLTLGIDYIGESTYRLKEVLNAFRLNDYESYLNSYTKSDFYSSERMQERRHRNNGGKLVSFKDKSCIFVWSESDFAPGVNVPIYHGDLTCPLVIDGDLYVFGIDYRSAMPPDYYEQNKEYVDNFLNRLGKENLPTFLMQNIIDEFSGIEFYGKVSQNYSDIENPDKLWDLISYEERAKVALQKYRKDNGLEIRPYKATKNIALYTEINGSIFIGRGYSDLAWKDGRTVKGPLHLNAEADLLNQLKNQNINVAGQEIVFYSDLGMCYQKGMCNDISQLVKELGIKKLTVKNFEAGSRVYK